MCVCISTYVPTIIHTYVYDTQVHTYVVHEAPRHTLIRIREWILYFVRLVQHIHMYVCLHT